MNRPAESRLDPEVASQLLAAARQARQHAYVPYSRFPVGAALLVQDGSVYTGCNIENSSFSLTNCAERVALQKAASEGHRSFRAIGVVGPEDDLACTPCGSCRQVLFEFAPDMLVVTPEDQKEGFRSTPLRDLLPAAFGPDRLAAGETQE